jgi:hypothetical protein
MRKADYDFMASERLERILELYYEQFGMKPRWVYCPVKSFRKYTILFDSSTRKPYLDEIHDVIIYT